MKATKGKILMSATSKEKAEKMLNEYHYSTSFKIDGETVSNSKGILPHFLVETKGNRVRVYRK